MNDPVDFGLLEAADSNERLSRLERWIVFWRGPRRETFGETDLRLDAFPLPATLRRLYKFAGRWTCPHPSRNSETEIFAIQDRIRTLDRLEISTDGKLIFLDDHSGNVMGATLPEGDDPPVWVADRLASNRQGPWRRVSDSLSETLVSVVLQESFVGSSFLLFDKSIDRWLHSSRDEVIPLWNGSAEPFTTSSSRYSLWNGSVLIRESLGDIGYGASHFEGITFLREHQGEIERLRIGFDPLAVLTIHTDGAAEVEFLNESNASGHAPQGTFNFSEERDCLVAISSARIPEGSPWFIQLARTGQATCPRLGILDSDHAILLFKKAVSAVSFKSAHFDEQLKRLPAW